MLYCIPDGIMVKKIDENEKRIYEI